MRNYQETIALIVGALVYGTATVYWEIALGRIVWWWGEQLILLRPSLSQGQAGIYTLVALIFVTVVIPHFVWFPVTLFKELKYLYNGLDSQHATA